MKRTLAGVVLTSAIVSGSVGQRIESGDSAAVAASAKGCPSRKPGMQFRVAYEHVFIEAPRGPTLSMRVSIKATDNDSRDLLQRVGCAIAAKYRNQRNWQALVFSDYEAAKSYEPPEPGQSEPPQYLGACLFYSDRGLTDMTLGEVICGAE